MAIAPGDISPDTYQQWVAKYSVLGVEPPPAERVTISENVELKVTDPQSIRDSTKYDLQNDASATPGLLVPDGYRADRWTATFLSFTTISPDPEAPNPNEEVGRVPGLELVVGTSSANFSPVAPGYLAARASVLMQGLGAQLPQAVGPLTGRIPVACCGRFTKGFEVNIILECVALPETLTAWKLRTYEAIVSAYNGLKRRHEEEKAARAVSESDQVDGRSSARNREIVREELKRGVLEMLTSM